MKILLYTHSDYSWVWEYWHQQTDKFLGNFKKICLLNSNSSFREDYHVIKYDDKLIYKDRVLSCLNNINDEEIVLFVMRICFYMINLNMKYYSIYRFN